MIRFTCAGARGRSVVHWIKNLHTRVGLAHARPNNVSSKNSDKINTHLLFILSACHFIILYVSFVIIIKRATIPHRQVQSQFSMS